MKELWKKKSIKIGIVMICSVVIFIIAAIAAQGIRKKQIISVLIESAQKYLYELDYEQAIAEYMAALEIAPNNQAVLDALERVYLEMARGQKYGSELAIDEFRTESEWGLALCGFHYVYDGEILIDADRSSGKEILLFEYLWRGVEDEFGLEHICFLYLGNLNDFMKPDGTGVYVQIVAYPKLGGMCCSYRGNTWIDGGLDGICYEITWEVEPREISFKYGLEIYYLE